MATPHIEATKGQIAKVVLMPGDPLRAEFIANKYLENVVKFNNVRNMFGFTGTYKGVEISVMGSGMGMPSIGIYSHELYSQYDVETIIRIGSAGSFQADINLGEVVLCNAVSTNSNWPTQFNLPGTLSLSSNFDILRAAAEEAEKQNVKYRVADVFSSDIFYDYDPNVWKRWADLGLACVEMESYALYANARVLNKNAFCMLTISDSLVTHESMSAEDRQNSFHEMMEVALETAIKFA